MPKLSELGLTTEQVGDTTLDYATMQDQLGSFVPPPQPGTYRFQLPTRMDDLWEVFDHPKGTPPGKRIRAKFDDAHALRIVQSLNGTHDGEPFMTSVSNAERRRGKASDPTAQVISDMDYINRDVFGVMQKPPTNPAYAQLFISHAGAEFTADVEWSWRCNDRKNIFADNGQGGLTEIEGTLGCGAGYYEKTIKEGGMMLLSDPTDPNSPKVFPLRITCACGGNVRAFANLTRFRT